MASGHPFQFPTYFPKEFAESQTKKMRKWPYLSPEAPNLKNKGTKFSSTFKFREKKVPLFFRFGPSGLRCSHFLTFKVPLFFRFGASGLRYGHFLIFLVWFQVDEIIQMRKWLYLRPETPNLKNKGTLLFNFQSWSKISVFIFLIWGLWAEIWQFSHFLGLVSSR